MYASCFGVAAKTAVVNRREKGCKLCKKVEVEVREKDVFDVKRKPLFYTSEHYKQRLRSKRLNHRITVEETIHFWKMRPSYLEAFENFYYDAPREMNAMN